jgi:NAD(P)-dependent dehydrogenase (short-subunit alcohol dehydrogenase family)
LGGRGQFCRSAAADYCRPEDIAEAIAYCLEDDSEFLTAQPLVVDGGWCLSNRI